MKAIKLTLLGIVSLVFLLIVGLVIAMITIDPNDFKKVAEDATKDATGLTLELGEIGWQFFPNIGLSVNQVSLTDSALPETEHTLVEAKTASIALAVMPLLQQQIRVNEVTLHSPMIQYITAADGTTNWDRLTKASSESTPETPDATQETASPSNLPDFAVAAIEITDASVRLVDNKAKTSTQVDNLNLRLTEVALDKPIPLTFSVAIAQDNTLDVALEGQGRVTVNAALDRFTLAPFDLIANIAKAPGINGAQQAKVSFEADANLAENLAKITALKASLAALSLQGDATISGLTTNPELHTTLKVAPFSPKKWVPSVLGTPLPPMSKDTSLTSLALDATIKGPLTGENANIKIAPLTLKLDASTLSGEAAINLTTQAITSNLNLDQMNLDDYLPPTPPESEADTPADAAAANEDQATPLIPVEVIRPLKAEFTFNAGKLIAQKMPIENLKLAAKANDGVVALNTFSANVLGGNISTKGSLDVRSGTPQIKLDHATQTLKLHPVIMAFLGKDVADGSISLSANLSTQGNTTQNLIKGLAGNSEFKLDDGLLKGINLTELAYKQLNAWGPLVSSLVPADYAQRVPPAFQKDTTIKNLLAQLEFKDGKILTKDLAAQVQGSEIQGDGELDMTTLGGTMRLNLKLSESLTNPTLAQLTWPIVCTFGKSPVPDCDLKSAPVREALEKMAKRALEDKAKAALEKELKDKLKLDQAQAAEDAAKAKLKAEEDAAKARLKAEEEAAKAKIREEEERAKKKAQEKIQDALQKLF